MPPWRGWAGRPGEPVNVGVLVDPDYRRQGVGRALVAALEVSVRRRGWAAEGVRGYGPAGFFDAASGWVRMVSSACGEVGRHLADGQVSTPASVRPIPKWLIGRVDLM